MNSSSKQTELKPEEHTLRQQTLIVVSRASFVEVGSQRRFHNLDGAYLEEIARGFSRVLIVAPVMRQGSENFTFQFRAGNIDVVEIPDAGGSRRLTVLLKTFWRQWQALRRLLRENPGALVFAFLPTYRAAAAVLYCAVSERPVIVYSGGVWSETIRLSPRWGNRRPWFLALYVAACKVLERLVFRCATVRLFTEATQLKQYGRLPRTYRTQPLTSLRPLATPPSRVLGKPVRLLCVGELLPVKGHDILYEAVALLAQRNVEITLALAGTADPAWKRQLDELAQERGIAGRINYAGWLADPDAVRGLYDGADIFVLPSRSEGFPRVLYEAMGSGLPVIASNIPNIAAVLQHEHHALLVPPGDAPALAAAIERLLRDGTLRTRLGRAAWEWSREQFRESAAEQFLHIVESEL